MGLEKLSALIVCPELAARTRLRSVLRSFIYKGTLEYERDLNGLLERLEAGELTDVNVLFLASSLGRSKIEEFVGAVESKRIKHVPPLIVFVTDELVERTAEIASLYIKGIDGFICEPYSVAEITDLVLAVFVKRQKKAPNIPGASRELKAIEFLLHDAMKHLDDLIRMMYNGEEPRGYPLRDLRNIAQTLRPFVEQNVALYAEIAMRAFEKSKPASALDLQKKMRKPRKVVLHPGMVVRQLMDSRGLTIDRLLTISRIDPDIFNALIKGQHSLDASIALELSRTLGMSKNEWLKLQIEYDRHAKNSTPAKTPTT